MSRMEPPPLACWMLEHCIPGERDEALAGDLLEEFQGGRSNGWYWQQALAAVVVGWTTYLGTRASLIVFAALWSMLAPAWVSIADRLEHRDVPWPVAVAWWVGLNVGFIWTGMALFLALHRRVAFAERAKELKKAFAVAAAIFLPVYFATFVLANLFAWPGLEIDWRTMSPLSEIVDFRVWADALRLPYFATLVWSLWRVAPVLAPRAVAVVEWGSQRPAGAGDYCGPVTQRDRGAVKRALTFMVATGLLNALIAGVVLCRLPAAHHPSVESMLVRAVLYVAIGAVAGIVGSYVYWHSPSSTFRDDPPLPFALFALVCAAGWMWVPATVLFSEQVSALGAATAMVGAFVIAGEVRRLSLLVVPAEQKPDWMLQPAESSLFAEVLYRPPAQPDGYVLALALYAAGWAIADGSNMTAAMLLAGAAGLFQVRTTFLRDRRFREAHEYRRAVLRIAGAAFPAILLTFWALLDGVAHRNAVGALNAAGTVQAKSSGDQDRQTKQATSAAHVGNGYESVILWPYPPKKQIVAPVQPAALLAPGTKQPVVIRFNGEYWYLQPPDVRPGPLAHTATGTPVDLHIASTNSFPLTMRAHQYLGSPVRVARCREIRVEIENRETAPGSLEVAMWLKSSSGAGSSAVYLGQQPVTSVWSGSGRPAEETLEFAVPPGAKMRSFDEITLLMLPDAGHRRVGPQIAIDAFELVPR